MKSATDVVVIGAGVAGLSAAVALSGAGARVTVLERRGYVGGRAYSYEHPALGVEIDSQHVLLGCCTNLLDLCRMSGADQALRWYDEVPFLEPGGRVSVLQAGTGPDAALKFLRAPMLSLRDKIDIARGLAEFVKGYPERDDESFASWLKRTRQSERAIRHFWEPVVVATLNDNFARCSTRYAAQVFREGFLKSAQGGRMAIPAEPLTRFYERVAHHAITHGTDLRTRASVERLEQQNGLWQLHLSSGETVEAENVVVALPFEQTRKLLNLPQDSRFLHSPITTIHFWFDRSVTDVDHCALLDTRIQWMFNKSRIRRVEGSEQYLELVISASHDELYKTREAILASALAELQTFFPSTASAKIVRSGILKEARATFSVVPGLDSVRPSSARGNGLFLAGDWMQSGWPSTMEGAARSGRLAAEAITGQKHLLPEAAATGWMRFFS